MRKFWVVNLFVLMMILVTGCGKTGDINEAENRGTVVVKKNNASELDRDEAEKEVDNTKGSEAEDIEVEALTEEEAQEIVYNYFLARLIIKSDIMDEIHMEDNYQLYYDNTTEEYQLLVEEFYHHFTPLVVESKVKEEADLFAEISTCECAYPIITPNQANVRFELLEQDAEEFVASFIKLGDFDDPSTGKVFVKFGYEADTWKYVESERQSYNEPLKLKPEELVDFGFNFATKELDPMSFVEYRTVDGVELLVMKTSMDYYGYEVDSGEMHIMYDY